MTNDMKYYGGMDKEGNKLKFHTVKMSQSSTRVSAVSSTKPKEKIQVRIQESTNPEKKLMAIFTKPNVRRRRPLRRCGNELNTFNIRTKTARRTISQDTARWRTGTTQQQPEHCQDGFYGQAKSQNRLTTSRSDSTLKESWL